MYEIFEDVEKIPTWAGDHGGQSVTKCLVYFAYSFKHKALAVML
jgi:hypothetical protein